MASRPAPRNRNDRALGLARVRAAGRPAPGIVRKDEIERQAWAAGLTQNEMGVWHDNTKTPAAKKLETAVDFLPMAALTDAASGVYNLLTTDYNPENIKYPTRMVPAGARGGGMVSGGQPNISDTIMGLGAAIKSSVEAAPITEFDKARYEKNPLSVRGSNLNLTPKQKSERSVQVMNADREKQYSNLLRTLKAAGITEEEMYRDVVVGPDGQVNFNANVQAMIAQLGNAADALRGTELIGYGLGKPVAVATRAATRAATRSVIPRAVGVATNPRLINAGQATLETLQRGGRPSEAVLGGVAALFAGNKPIGSVGTMGAWNVGATSRTGGLTRTQQEIERVVGKSLDEIQPNDWQKLIEEDPELVTGATHRPRSPDSNYNTNLAKRLAYNKLPDDIKANFSGKVPYDAWWKQLSEGEKASVKAAHKKPTTSELQEYSRILLNETTQVDEAGNLVWKDGGKDLFYSQQDLAHANPEGLPSVPGTDILGWLKRNINTSEGYKVGAGRK